MLQFALYHIQKQCFVVVNLLEPSPNIQNF